MRGFYETGPRVVVGDMFRDRDKRVGTRILRVVSVTQDGRHAYLKDVALAAKKATRVSVDRLLDPKLFAVETQKVCRG